MSEIVGIVSELTAIKNELKRLRIQVIKNNKRKKELENSIVEFLENKDQPGIKYKGNAILTTTKDIRARKNKQEKILDGIAVLKEHGVENSKQILSELMEAMQGEKTQTTGLKIKQLKIT